MMVVLFIISSLLSGNKKQKEQKPMPPFSNKNAPVFEQKRQQQPKKARTLEDFASEIFQQLNEKANPTVQPEVKMEKPTVVNEKSQNSRPTFDVNRSSKQLAKVTENQQHDVIKSKEIGSFIPKDRDALVQAIITSEILGTPKAKQR